MNDAADLKELFRALASVGDAKECQMVLTDLCTPAELTAMADRWKAARLVKLGLPYREIYDRTGISTATVTRVARCLTHGAGGYELLLQRRTPMGLRQKPAATTRAPRPEQNKENL